MSGGFAVNYGTYALLYTFFEIVQRYPELGVAAGSVSGLAVNYVSSRWWIYRRDAALISRACAPLTFSQSA